MPRPARRRGCRLVTAIALLTAGALAAAAAGQEAGAVAREGADAETPEFELGAAARAHLTRLQSGWLEWLAAVQAGDLEAAAAAEDTMLRLARDVDMEWLPELAIGAAAQALQLSEAGKGEAAAAALAAAERLDPGRPETAFAASRVAWRRGSYLQAIAAQARGYLRSPGLPGVGPLLLHHLGYWLAAVVTLSALGFVALQMMGRGPGLYADLLKATARYMPALLARPLVWALLLWPVALPGGPLWLALYWSVLLWSRATLLERGLHAAVWLLLAVLSPALTLQARAVSLDLTPGLMALDSAGAGRLEGRVFGDLPALQARLADRAAMRHAEADLHRKVDQCDLALEAYRAVLESEPDNVAALNDRGVCLFRSGAVERAVESFETAVDAGEPPAEVFFNLSQAQAERYRFFQSEEALREARALDSDRVSGWIDDPRNRSGVSLNGGVRRGAEVRAALALTTAGTPRFPGAGLSLALVGGLLLAAGSIQLLGRGSGRKEGRGHGWLPRGVDRVRRVLLPGVPEAERGEWLRAPLALGVAVALASAIFIGDLGHTVLWGVDPGPWLPAALAAAGLGVGAAARYLLERGRG